MQAFVKHNIKKLINLIVIAIILLGLYIGIKYVFIFLAPFLIATVISAVNEPIILFIEKKTNLNRKISTVITLTLCICSIATLAISILFKIYAELIKLQSNLPNYITSISYLISSYYSRINALYNNLPLSVQENFKDNVLVLLPKLEEVITIVASSIITSISSLPKLGIFITVVLLSSYFISSDKDNIRNFLYRQIPRNSQKNFYKAKNGAVSSIFGYFRAQLIIMAVTFVISTLGFVIINTEYAVIMGLLTAIADGIPLLGSGIVMVPWIILNFITGNVRIALGLLSVYLFAIIVRQIIEPKIVSSQTGLHPLVALISMYLGLMIFGVLGLFLGPITMILLKNLHSSGIITIWKDSQ
ncbi:MAG: sporulation integral membrane protein YtvI [Clostridiaceae bacterium]|jgi:sporulation integral membrane protein YtvI|nr:sporulation integral membrane protein YtvI [Clostridiaceae bacterium]